MVWDVFLQAHLYILNNVDEFQPYLSAHKRLMRKQFPQMIEKWMLTKHNKWFINWFNESVSKDRSVSGIIKWISYMHKFNVTTWRYAISKFSFYTKSKDDCSTVQNSGGYGWG